MRAKWGCIYLPLPTRVNEVDLHKCDIIQMSCKNKLTASLAFISAVGCGSDCWESWPASVNLLPACYSLYTGHGRQLDLAGSSQRVILLYVYVYHDIGESCSRPGLTLDIARKCLQLASPCFFSRLLLLNESSDHDGTSMILDPYILIWSVHFEIVSYELWTATSFFFLEICVS